MMEYKRKFGSNSSGQLLIVAALTIAILISSTTIYVYKLSSEMVSTEDYLTSNIILALKQSARNTMISSLSNISKGGNTAILEENLNNLSQAVKNLYKSGIHHLAFTSMNNSKYDSGIWLSWDKNGSGVSSAHTNFTLKTANLAANMTAHFVQNITTTIVVDGSYTRLEDQEKLVNLTCQVFNDGNPALAKNITLFYRNLTTWIRVNQTNNLSVTDCGNGTYLLSFNVTTSSDVQVSTHIRDLRDIIVRANTTCTEA